MDIKKEQNSFKKTMLDQHGEYDEEHFELDSYGNFSWIGTDDHFEIWMLCAKAKQAEIDELKGKLAKAQAVPEFPVTVFDEWIKNRHEKTGLYEEALWGKDDATYIRHEMRKAFQAGWKEKQAVQEGFVVVEREKLAMIFETATNALVYHAEPPKHDALSIIQGIARKAMIEAQEQTQ